ncbi:hypothetical protein CK203_029017 [Vitis vinifera]|uniref:Uncharacterized protein n=1 Tax=Vitis vinifera TaxID=29760 RepID=A0A438IN02_VITVI|nr:hypothetical protein CK203_029017 [Vitis vinifera]
MPAKVSAHPFSVRLIFSIVHSVNRCKTRSLETDRARARSNPDKMASYSASLLEAGNPSRMTYSRCSPVGDCSRSPTPDLDDREAPSTRKSTILFHLIPSVAFFRLSLACAECCEGVDRSARPPGGLGNRGGAFGQRYEGLRLLAPFLSTGFLRLPMLC